MTRSSGRFTAVMAVAGVVAAGPAFAGDENTLRIIQQGSDNSLFADQSGASNSLIIGPSDALTGNNDTPPEEGDGWLLERLGDSVSNRAEQLGDNNEATIVMTGNGGELQILQDNSGGNVPPVGNVATVEATGNNTLGAVLQEGDNNNATLNLTDNNARGLISQFGDGNTGTLTVEENGSGALFQIGEGLNDPEVVVRNGTNASVTIQEDTIAESNLPSDVGAIEVFSTNPGTITINQTSN